MVEGHHVLVLGHLEGGEELAGEALLLGQEHAVAVIAEADVQGEAIVRISVVQEQAVAAEAVDGVDRGAEANLEGRAVLGQHHDVVRVVLLPDGLTGLVQDFAANLELVVAAQLVVDVGRVGAARLIAPALEEPVAAAAGDGEADRVLDAGTGLIVVHQAKVVAELAGAHFKEAAAADGAVVFELANPGRGVLRDRRTGHHVLGVADDRVGAVGLTLDSELEVGDELVLGGHLVGDLARVVAKLVQELRSIENRARGRLVAHVVLAEESGPGPELVLDDRPADADVEVLVAHERVGLGAIETKGRDDVLRQVAVAAEELIVRDVRRLDVGVLILVVDLAGELVAAALADEVRDHAAAGHFGGVAGRANDDFIERAVIEVEARCRRAFRRVDALDERTVLAAVAVRGVGALRTGRAAADVEAAQLDAGRRGKQRPHVARVRKRVELIFAEVDLGARAGGVDRRTLAHNRDLVGHRLDAELCGNVRGEADADADVGLLLRSETRQFELH